MKEIGGVVGAAGLEKLRVMGCPNGAGENGAAELCGLLTGWADGIAVANPGCLDMSNPKDRAGWVWV